jgi:hypothetical protein
MISANAESSQVIRPAYLDPQEQPDAPNRKRPHALHLIASNLLCPGSLIRPNIAKTAIPIKNRKTIFTIISQTKAAKRRPFFKIQIRRLDKRG